MWLKQHSANLAHFWRHWTRWILVYKWSKWSKLKCNAHIGVLHVHAILGRSLNYQNHHRKANVITNLWPLFPSAVSFPIDSALRRNALCTSYYTELLMAGLKPSVKISLALLLHFSCGSAALLLVRRSSYPIMSGAMLEWSPCPYLPHII